MFDLSLIDWHPTRHQGFFHTLGATPRQRRDVLILMQRAALTLLINRRAKNFDSQGAYADDGRATAGASLSSPSGQSTRPSRLDAPDCVLFAFAHGESRAGEDDAHPLSVNKQSRTGRSAFVIRSDPSH